ncbi:MAG: antibiotic biosynthesis monooxygenase [Acidimicrobiia bacterium]|nr:antibiotic biosynthesis monooxygenase [Acidimicrobiia bacterium]
MLLVAIEFHVAPENRSRFAEIADALADPTREEHGCRFFEFWSDLGGTGLFLAYEGWETPAALEEHRTTPHLAAFRLGAAELDARVVSASYYTATETSV